MSHSDDAQMDVDGPSARSPSSSSRRRILNTSERRASSLPPKHPRMHDAHVGYVYDSRMMSHTCISGHPEQPDRIRRIYEAFQHAGLVAQMRALPIRPAERDEVLLVHSETLWDKVMAIGGARARPLWRAVADPPHPAQT